LGRDAFLKSRTKANVEYSNYVYAQALDGTVQVGPPVLGGYSPDLPFLPSPNLAVVEGTLAKALVPVATALALTDLPAAAPDAARSRSPADGARGRSAAEAVAVEPSRRVYATKLAENANQDTVEGYFSRFGEVRRVKILSTDHEGGRAVVTFQRFRSAQAAMEKDGHRMSGRIIGVMMARHR
jgi:hypothetical protein